MKIPENMEIDKKGPGRKDQNVINRIEIKDGGQWQEMKEKSSMEW